MVPANGAAHALALLGLKLIEGLAILLQGSNHSGAAVVVGLKGGAGAGGSSRTRCTDSRGDCCAGMVGTLALHQSVLQPQCFCQA
jgi:hypothetical protein